MEGPFEFGSVSMVGDGCGAVQEMTAAWCLRRAELVLKCVKGFALEAHGGGGAALRTLTAAVPGALAPAVFAALAALLPGIFRVAGPVRARPAR